MDIMQIYVGTYHKYNCGSIAGKWLDVEDYSDKEEFLEACKELHSDESDPELMFQDHEGIPSGYIKESHVAEELWTEFIPLDESEREFVSLYIENIDEQADIEDIKDRFRGKYDSLEDYAYELVNDTTDMKSLGWLSNYIDYEAIGRDMRLGGDVDAIEHEGSVWIFDSH